MMMMVMVFPSKLINQITGQQTKKGFSSTKTFSLTFLPFLPVVPKVFAFCINLKP